MKESIKISFKTTCKELRTFLALWSTQSLSQLGSSMTAFALTLWLYEKTGSALQTALLSICTYAPYVMMSIFAGALSDRWDKKKVMLVCDTLAAGSTLVVFVLLKADLLAPGHLYLLNVLNGLMNTLQQPAGDVAMTLIIPKKHYQKTSGMRSFSNSLITILNPVLATTLYSLFGMNLVIAVDLGTFAVAFLTLLFGVRLPKIWNESQEERESLLLSARSGLVFLKENGLVFTLILFLAGVNLVASAFDAVLPALVLSSPQGGEMALGLVTSTAGVAMLIGSLLATFMKRPKDRVRVIYLTMLVSLSTENFLLALTRTPVLWCLGQLIGWLPVPIMSANLDVILRASIPVEMQGRVYSCRNTLQFFTIPVGFFLGGFLVDQVCEPLMAQAAMDGGLVRLFGAGKGSGAAMVMFLLGAVGTLICLVFGQVLKKYHYDKI
ncbi:MAG: MFS transporter [Lachnospiraceae bacterium]|nr:MFS transporter [Lachnospiraceae bacterium]